VAGLGLELSFSVRADAQFLLGSLSGKFFPAVLEYGIALVKIKHILSDSSALNDATIFDHWR